MNFLNFFKILAIAIVEIIERPASDSIRFRYASDERLSGPVMGANSTEDEPTFPTICINTFRYNGPVCVITSCVSTKYEPYMPHPNSLLGHNCTGGVRTDCIKNGPYPKIIKFSDLNIERMKMKDVKEKLNEREKLDIDPFLTGFSHKDNKELYNRHIDTKEVRLCFQVFLSPNGKTVPPVATLVSDPIRSNPRVLTDLNINRISHCTSSVNGGQEIIILCSAVYMRDLQIRFYEKYGNEIVWEERVRAKYVHKNCAITLDTPKYKSSDIDEPVNVFIQLEKPSCRSDPIPFQYIRDPCNSFAKMKDPKAMKSEVLLRFSEDPSKRIRTNENINSDINQQSLFYSTERQHGYQSQQNFNNFLMAPSQEQPSRSSNIQLPSSSRNIQLPSSSTHVQQPPSRSNLPLPSFSTILHLPVKMGNVEQELSRENSPKKMDINQQSIFYSTERQHGYQSQQNVNNFLMVPSQEQPSRSSTIHLPSSSRNIQLPSSSTNLQQPPCSSNIQLPSSSTFLQLPVKMGNVEQELSGGNSQKMMNINRQTLFYSTERQHGYQNQQNFNNFLMAPSQEQPSCSSNLIQQPSCSINLEQQEQNQQNWGFSPLLHSNAQLPLENELEPSWSSQQHDIDIQQDIDIDFDFDEYWKI